MPALLRLAELLVCGLFIGWTVIFPLATLLSLMLTLPVLLLLLWPARGGARYRLVQRYRA